MITIYFTDLLYFTNQMRYLSFLNKFYNPVESNLKFGVLQGHIMSHIMRGKLKCSFSTSVSATGHNCQQTCWCYFSSPARYIMTSFSMLIIIVCKAAQVGS